MGGEVLSTRGRKTSLEGRWTSPMTTRAHERHRTGPIRVCDRRHGEFARASLGRPPQRNAVQRLR
jgi:hypothetical protein